MVVERTLVITKPETVKRGIVGEIVSRFEKKGLKIIGMKMAWPDQAFISKHYTEEMAEAIGLNTKKNMEKTGQKFEADPKEHGMKVVKNLRTHMTECPVIAFVLEGPHAIDLVRKMSGSTSPNRAEIGTIRGDYTADSYELADNQAKSRSVRNIIHTSDRENAENEIKLWFRKEELFDYKHPLQDILYG